MENRLDNRPTCPNCSKTLDGFTDPSGKNIPKPEDASICAYCGEMAEFDKDMELIPMPEEHISRLSLIDIQRAMRLRQMFLDKKGKH